MTSDASQIKKRWKDNAQKIAERNAALRAARNSSDIDEIAKNFGLTETQKKVLKDLLKPLPNIESIAGRHGMRPRNVHVWARIAGRHGQGRKQTPHNKMDSADEQEIKDDMLRVGDKLNLAAMRRKYRLAKGTIDRIAREVGVYGRGVHCQPHPKKDMLVIEWFENPGTSGSFIAGKIGTSRALANRVRGTIAAELRAIHEGDGSMNYAEAVKPYLQACHNRLLPIIQGEGIKTFETLQKGCERAQVCVRFKDPADFRRLHIILDHMFPGMKREKLGLLGADSKMRLPNRDFLHRTTFNTAFKIKGPQ